MKRARAVDGNLRPETQVISSVGKQTSQPKLDEEDDDEPIYDDDVFTPAKSSVSFLPTEACDFIFIRVEDATERTSYSKPGLLDLLFLLAWCI